MLKLDTLSQLKQLKEDIKASRNLEEGVVKGSAYKFGFVTLDSGRDVYLPPDQMERVLPGDRVEVEIVKDAKNKKVAKLERLIESNTKFFCGKYITKGKTHFIEPDINGMTRWFFVPPNKRKDAKMKDMVECKITQHPYKSGKAQAAVVSVIGTEHDTGIETRYASIKHRISENWSKEATDQLETITEESIETLSANRTDLTDIPFVTIDAETTKDIDDALYAEKTENGWTIQVAIADPSSLIKAGSAIEKEAIKRASSIYFPGKHIPMLPSKLGSELCSLLEAKKRLAKVLRIEISDQGEVLSNQLDNAVISSHKKLSYQEASEFIDKGEGITDEKIADSLTQLNLLSKVLLEKRQNDFILPAERKEFYFELDEKGKATDIKPKTTSTAHKLVEEMMILANRCIATQLASTNKNSIFVSHEGIREDRRESLDKVLDEEIDSYTLGDITQFEKFVPCYRELLTQSDNNDLALLISRQLEKSVLSSTAKPHFGMGIESYTNFTSPLRKAVDYLVHKQLDSIIQGSQADIKPSLVDRIEDATQNIRNAVYDVEQWLRCQYISANEEIFDAKVQRVFSSGFHVKLDVNGIEGFISTKEMDEKFSFNQERLTLTSKTHALKLETPVKVKVKHIDWSRKQIQFELLAE